MKAINFFYIYRFYGYYQIYDALMQYFREDNIWNYFGAMFLIFVSFVLCISVFYFVRWINAFYPDLMPSTIALTPGIIIAFFFIPFLFRVVTTMRNPYWNIPELAALMLVFIPRPNSNVKGLSYVDVKNLLGIAETEQSAADWRGTSINLVVVGTITLTAGWILVLINEVRGNSTLAKILAQSVEGMDIYVCMGIFSIGLVIFGYLFYKLYTYFVEYVLGESANRIIIFACKELIALLEEKNLKEENIPFHKKRALIEHFGCSLMKVVDYDLPLDIYIRDNKNNLWTLNSQHGYLKLPHFYIWRSIREKISQVFGDIQHKHKS